MRCKLRTFGDCPEPAQDGAHTCKAHAKWEGWFVRAEEDPYGTYGTEEHEWMLMEAEARGEL